MPAGFTRDEILAIAALAHLELDGEEIDLFTRQLGDILAYANVVQQIDTAGIAPTAAIVGQNALERPDEVRGCLDRDDVLAGAPDAAPDAGFFRVPRVIG
jgi:aspartyl-tRNA(Asn)/glutamyl-tRNA(Gln) amidotransferase subunit C